MERTRQDEIRLVRFLYADHGGIIRGKAAGTARLRERMSSGIGHTVAMMAMSMLDQLQPVRRDGPGRRGPDRAGPGHVRRPALRARCRARCWRTWSSPDGSPWEACPRTFLKQALAELAGEGYGDAGRVRARVHRRPAGDVARRAEHPGPAHPHRRQPVLLLHRLPSGARLRHRAGRGHGGAGPARSSTTTPNSATASTSSRSGTPTRCVPPTTTCCTGRRSAGWRSAAACGRAWPPSRSPTRPATALTCTAR